jgi:hypothetical protein
MFAGLAVYIGVRAWVLQGDLHYARISGVDEGFYAINWQDSRWPPQLLCTVGPLVPFAVLAWQRAPRPLRWLTLYLAVVLFVSSLLFSWLVETRNFMPLVAVLAVLNALQITPKDQSEPCHSSR